MSKRKLTWGAAIVALVIGGIGLAWNFFGVDQISMTQAEIQSRIDEKMPNTQKGVTISDVKLDLTGDKIGLTLNASTTKFKTEYRMSAATRGTLRYDSLAGSFYFLPEMLKVNDVQANGASVADKVGGFIDKYVDSPKIVDRKAELMAQAEELAQSVVTKSAETVLRNVPVYKLKNDFKGHVIKVFLKDVEVKDGKVIAHLSLLQFTKMMLLYGFIAVIAIGVGIALLLNPEWGLPLLLLGSIDT